MRTPGGNLTTAALLTFVAELWAACRCLFANASAIAYTRVPTPCNVLCATSAFCA